MHTARLLAPLAMLMLYISVSAQNKDSLLRAFNNKNLADTLRFDAGNLLRMQYEESNTDSGMIMGWKLYEFSKTMKDEHCRAMAIFNLGYEHFVQGKYREAIKYYTEALQAYKKINKKNGTANSYSNMALAQLRLGEYEEAYANYLLADQIFAGIKDTNKRARTYNQLALIRDYQGRWLESLDLYFHSLRLFEEMNDKYGQSVILINIATIYGEMNDKAKSMEMLNKALAMKKEVGDDFGEAIILSILAENLTELGDYTGALNYHHAALTIFEKYNAYDKIASGNCGIGRVYLKQKDFTKALAYYEKGVALERQMELNTELSVSLSHLGEMYIYLDRVKEAIKACNEGLAISLSTGNLDARRQNCRCLANAWENSADPAKALKYYREYMAVNDSLINNEKTKEATRKEMNFRFAKQQLKDSLEYAQQKEISDLQLSRKEAIIRSERAQKVGLYIGLALLLISGTVTYRSYRIKKKDNLLIAKQKAEAEEQRNLIQAQKHLVEEKQKEIIDSITYARRIQTSLLPPEKYIHRTLSRIKH